MLRKMFINSRFTDRGQTLLEFALMLPCLVLLSVGIVEVGRAIYYTIEVNNAATAGVENGSQSLTDVNVSKMQSAALADAGLGDVMTATATYGCTCDRGAGTSCTYPVPAQGTCTSIADTCTAPGQIVQCVQVTTHATFTPIFRYPGLPASYTANGEAVMRVRR